MKPAEKMTNAEKLAALEQLQNFIESAVESEQDEPAEFKLETQRRIDLIIVNLCEILNVPNNS
jgi:hypothetical protein